MLNQTSSKLIRAHVGHPTKKGEKKLETQLYQLPALYTHFVLDTVCCRDISNKFNRRGWSTASMGQEVHESRKGTMFGHRLGLSVFG